MYMCNFATSMIITIYHQYNQMGNKCKIHSANDDLENTNTFEINTYRVYGIYAPYEFDC